MRLKLIKKHRLNRPAGHERKEIIIERQMNMISAKLTSIKHIRMLLCASAWLCLSFQTYAQEQSDGTKKIDPIAYEIATQISSSQQFADSLANSTNFVIQKVRELFPALTPEAAEAFANNYLDLVIEKLAPLQVEIQARVFNELFTDEELVKLKEITETPDGTEVMLKFITAMRVQGVLIGQETINEQQEVFDAAVKKTIEQGHKLSYAQQE